MTINNKELANGIIRFSSVLVNKPTERGWINGAEYKKLQEIASEFGHSGPKVFVYTYREQFQIFGIDCNGQHLYYLGEILI